MPQPTSGILLPTPVRVNNTDDNYPIALAIDIQGGVHNVKTIADRDAIKQGRREWGMLCTVYDDSDPTKNGTYQLIYNASNDNIMNPLNWRLFSGAPPTTTNNVVTGEWLSSVISIVDSPVSPTPSNTERFLIGSPSFAEFLGQSYKVAEWDSSANGGTGAYIYSTPTNGATLRVDNQKNLIYKFNGTWSEGGFWQKEYLSQVRYINPTSTDGSTYSFTSSTEFVPLDAYSYSSYFANFNYTNSGTSNLQIDGLGYFPMKKLNSGTLIDLNSGDLVPNIQYHLSWYNGGFQVMNIGNVAGASAGVIGPPEDSTYGDGLFTDFTQSTPIGVPIDRFNEILKALVPAPAPDLKQATLGGVSFTGGKLAFDSTNASGYGVTPAPSISIGGDFNSSGYRKGINSFVINNKAGFYDDYTGVLNGGVSESEQRPTPSYGPNAFGNGITGSIVMKLNNVTVATVDLGSSLGPLSNSSNGSSLSVSAATTSKFPSGVPFEFFWWRTGSFLISKTDPRLVAGYNYLDITHVLPTNTLTVPKFDWVSDPSTVAVTYTGNSVLNIVGANPKFLSGIKYWTTLSLDFSTTIANHVNRTYVGTGALTVDNSAPGGANGINGRITTNSGKIFGNPNAKNINTPNNPLSSQLVTWSFTSVNSNVRRLSESITITMNVARTVQNEVSTTFTEDKFFLDNYPDSNTDKAENFTNETTQISSDSGLALPRRVRNSSIPYDTNTHTVQSINGLFWDSTKSLYLDSGFSNGLQVIGGELVYPRCNFGNTSSVAKNPNFNGGNAVNYSLCNTIIGYNSTANRVFTRLFRIDSTSNFAKITFNLTYDSTTFVKVGTNLSPGQPNAQTNCYIEVKLPYDTRKTPPSANAGGLFEGSSVTGWMDMTERFNQSENYANGSGAYTGTKPSGSGQAWNLDFGLKGTGSSNGYILLRITAGPAWLGAIRSISCDRTP